jgi:superfamily I DNA and/or RNA helicase
VFISLVRNNRKSKPEGLGFLRSKERLNVLISRPSRLLVLAGSWSFFEQQLHRVDRPDTEHLSKLMQALKALRDKGRLAFLKCDQFLK